MALAQNFVQPIVNCAEAQNAGSCILLAPLPDCQVEPSRYIISVAAAVAPGDTTADLQIVAAEDCDGVAITPLPATITLKADTILHYEDAATPGTYNTIKIVTAVDVPSAAAVTATIVTEDTIAVTDVAQTWALQEITDATDLPINSDTQEDDRKVLKNGLQGSSVKTDIKATVALQMITNPENKAQFGTLFQASQSSEDIYVAVVKSSGYTVFGRAKVMSYNINGAINGIERVSATLNFQAPFALTYLTADTDIESDPTTLANLALFGRLAGLPPLM